MLHDKLGTRKYLTLDERKIFLEAALTMEPRVATFCLMLAYTGARISEVLALTPRAIDYAAHTVAIQTLKKRKRGVFRIVPVPDWVLTRVNAIHATSVSANGPMRSDGLLWPWSRTTAWHRVKVVMSLAQLGGAAAMPKGLRHCFAVSAIIDAGVPVNIVQRWLGHSRLETTAIYANVIGYEERLLAERMWESFEIVPQHQLHREHHSGAT